MSTFRRKHPFNCFFHWLLALTYLCRCMMCTAQEHNHDHEHDHEHFCGIADEHHHHGIECTNIYTCSAVTLSPTSPTTCAAEHHSACTEELDDLGIPHGDCHAVDETDVNLVTYCAIHSTKDLCLTEASGTRCVWHQHCVADSHLCHHEEYCTQNEACHLNNGVCELVDDGSSAFYTQKWVAATVMLLLTLLALGVPYIAAKKVMSGYHKVEAFLYTASAGALVSIAHIHLLSEGDVYAGSAGFNDALSGAASDHWTTFAACLVGVLVFDSCIHALTGDMHSDDGHGHHGGLKKAASNLAICLKYLSIVIHGAQEGLVVGMQSAELTWPLTVVIILHKLLFTLSVGQDLKSNPSNVQYALCVLFVLSTPVGVIIGAYAMTDTDAATFAHLNAFCAAVLLKFGLEALFELPSTIYYSYQRKTQTKDVGTLDNEISSSSESLDEDLTGGDGEAKAEIKAADRSSSSDDAQDEVKALESDHQAMKTAAVTRYQPPIKYQLCQYLGHYIVLLVLTGIVFGLMCWHLSVHDHSGEDGHDHSGHDHAH